MGFKFGSQMVSIKKVPAETVNAIKAKVEEGTAFQVRKGIIQLVKEDIKKRKVGDLEQYIQKSIFAIKKHQMSNNMIKKAGMDYADVGALIRATVKEAQPDGPQGSKGSQDTTKQQSNR